MGGPTDFVARQQKLAVSKIKVEAAVGIGTLSEGGFGLKVDLTVTGEGIVQAEAEKLVEKAHWSALTPTPPAATSKSRARPSPPEPSVLTDRPAAGQDGRQKKARCVLRRTGP